MVNKYCLPATGTHPFFPYPLMIPLAGAEMLTGWPTKAGVSTVWGVEMGVGDKGEFTAILLGVVQ